MQNDLGVPVKHNSSDVDVVDGKLRLYFLPYQSNSTLYVDEAVLESPLEYSGSMEGVDVGVDWEWWR